MPIQFAAVVAQYGYAAAFVGTLWEGETVLILSGLAADRGYLELLPLFVLGAAAAILTDNFFFALGRKFGPLLLVRFPRFAPAAARVHALIARFPRSAIFAMRFLYGTRTVGPAVIGSGDVGWPRFAILDVLAAAVWSVCWVSVGYAVGEALEQFLNSSAGIGRWLALSLAGGAVLAILALYLGHRKQRARLRAELERYE